MNGPVPSMWVVWYRSPVFGLLNCCHVPAAPSQSPCDAAHFRGMTAPHAAMIDRNGANGCLRRKTTESPSADTARATWSNVTWIFPWPSRVLSTPRSGLKRSHAGPPDWSCSRNLRNEYTTSSTVIIEPS